MNNRNIVVVASVVTNALSKAFGFLAIIISVKLSLGYLGEEAFGLWMTLASMITMLSFLDFGIGNALINKIADAVHSDIRHLRSIISSNLLCILLLALGLCLLLHISSPYIPWDSLIRFEDPSLRPQFFLSLDVFYLLFPLNLISLAGQKVLVGLQKAPGVNVLNLIGSVLSILTTIYLTGERSPIPELILGTIGIPIIINLFIYPYLYSKGLLQFRISLLKRVSIFRNVYKNSGYFFIIQLGSFAGWGIDSVIISSALGVSVVAQYSVLQKLFQFISQPLAIINGPLWVAYADAKAKDEFDFISKAFKKSMLITLIATICAGIFLLAYGKNILGYWTDGKIMVSSELLFIYLCWILCETMGNCFAMFLNGVGFLKPQVFSTVIFIVLAISFKWIGAYFGLESFIFAGIAAYLISTPVFYYLFYRIEIKRLIRQT